MSGRTPFKWGSSLFLPRAVKLTISRVFLRNPVHLLILLGKLAVSCYNFLRKKFRLELVMARRIHPRNTPRGMLRSATRFPWQLFIIIPLLIAVAIPTFVYMFGAGGKIMPSITDRKSVV